jgi:hypothetical protein
MALIRLWLDRKFVDRPAGLRAAGNVIAVAVKPNEVCGQESAHFVQEKIAV